MGRVSENKLCYVYEHFIVHSGEVFYVGKGSGYRAKNSTERSEFWQRKTARFKWDYRIVKEFNNDFCALTYEKLLIAKYGRRANGTGQLVNLNDGGVSGNSGGKYGVVYKYKDGKRTGLFRNVSTAAKHARVSTKTLKRLILQKKETSGFIYSYR